MSYDAIESDSETSGRMESRRRPSRIENKIEDEDDDNFTIDYDAILTSVGGWGKFQQILFNGTCFPVLFATILMFSITVFSSAVPKFRCRIPECDVANATYEDAFVRHFDTFTIPGDIGAGAQCLQYSYISNTSLAASGEDQCQASRFNLHEVTECKEWIYETSVYSTTFMSEANIVCNNGWKGPLSQSIFFFGVLLANLTSGLLADKFGRRHVVMSCILLLTISAFGLIFVTSYELYVLMAFLLANAQAGLFLVTFILTMEIVGPAKRVYCGVILEIFFNLGEILVAVLSFWLRDWRLVISLATVPVIFFLLYWPILPESIRWLLANKKYNEAQITTNRISYWNKTPLVDITSFRTIATTTEQPGEKETMLDLIKDSVLFPRLINMCFTWLVIVLGYYGLSLTSVSLSGDPYVNFFLVSLVELPGYAFAWIGMEKIGRRMTMVISLVSGGAALLAKGAVDFAGKSNDSFFFWFNMVAFLVGKCGLTSAFGAVYVYNSELFPTSIRSAGVGTCSTFGRLGAIVTPWISDQAKRTPWVVMVFFGGSAVVSGLLNLLLPETLGQPLPETLAQTRSLSQKDKTSSATDEEEEPLLRR